MAVIYQDRIDAYKQAAKSMRVAPVKEHSTIQDQAIKSVQAAARPNAGMGNAKSLIAQKTISEKPWRNDDRIAQLRDAANHAALGINGTDTTNRFDDKMLTPCQKEDQGKKRMALELEDTRAAVASIESQLDFPIRGLISPELQ